MRAAVLSPDIHEALVAACFDRLQARFKAGVGPGDVRLDAIKRCLGPLAGLRVLDLGCGKGRFAGPLADEGAEVAGLDRSRTMLQYAPAAPLLRIQGSARRLPFASRTFDAVIAVEVFEHLPVPAIDAVLLEVRGVLRPGGSVVIVDKNAASWNAERPWLPNLVVKWIDERRGRWMYPAGGPVRERWFWPAGFARRLGRFFSEVRVQHLLTPAEARHRLFRRVPRTRQLAVWSARAPGGRHV